MKRIGAVVMVAMVLAGCGSSSGEGSKPTTTVERSTTSEAATTTTASDGVGYQEQESSGPLCFDLNTALGAARMNDEPMRYLGHADLDGGTFNASTIAKLRQDPTVEILTAMVDACAAHGHDA